METKKCSLCGEIKELSEFCKRSKDGLESRCRMCMSIRFKLYNQTKEGLISKIYKGQKSSSKKRKHSPPTYTKQELRDWLYSQPLFHELYDNWRAAEYTRQLSPSCDRTDDYKGYSLDRLKLMTWQENKDKAHKDMREGKLINGNKPQKAVIGTHKVTGKVIYFHSMNEAMRWTGIYEANISSCCLGKRKSAGGYAWKYAN